MEQLQDINVDDLMAMLGEQINVYTNLLDSEGYTDKSGVCQVGIIHLQSEIAKRMNFKGYKTIG